MKDTEIISFYNNLDQNAKKNQETTISRFVQSVVQLILDLPKAEMPTVENLW